MELPLADIKILDLTRVLAGPYCTMVLADLGAEVIKVEKPNTGDDSRAFGPYINEESAYFMSLNRSKKSITVNLKSKEGINIIKELCKKVDVVVENFKPGTMDKLGIGYTELKKVNPNIIYASSSGFGHSGPYSERPAYDGVVQAMGGIMSITGPKGGEPTRVGPSVGDIFAGVFSAIGILSALNKRQVDGVGSNVDVAMLDCQVAVLENALSRYFASGISPEPEGNRHSSIVPFEPFETKDGKIMIAVGNDKIWAKFCKVINKEDLINSPKYKTNFLRSENYKELRPIISDVIIKKTTDVWKEKLIEAGIPSGPINNIKMVVEDEQINARNMIQEIEHPTVGKVKMAGIPIKIKGCSDDIRFTSPLLGQHNEEVFKEYLNYSEEHIKKLKEEKII